MMNLRFRSRGLVMLLALASFSVIILPTALYAEASEDNYMASLDKAAGNKTASISADNKEGDEVKLLNTSSRDELESFLAQSYPEEHAVYQKFSNYNKNEVINMYEKTQGKPDAVRAMKVINLVGLVSNRSDW